MYDETFGSSGLAHGRPALTSHCSTALNYDKVVPPGVACALNTQRIALTSSGSTGRDEPSGLLI